MIGVVIIDDEVLARIGIRAFLETQDNIRINGCFGTAAEALAYLHKGNHTDIVITDIEMAEMSGLELIAEVKKNKLAKGTIIVSSHNDFEYARRAMKLGADGYILKQEINQEELVKEIEKVYRLQCAVPGEHSGSERNIQEFVNTRKEGQFLYQIGVLYIQKTYDDMGNIMMDQVNETMFTGLIESIVSRYENTYLFAPYQKEMFLIFAFDLDTMEEQRAVVEDICYELRQNIRLYINKELTVGISKTFQNLEQVQFNYNEAVGAAKLSFYKTENPYYYEAHQVNQVIIENEFDTNHFTEKEGMEKVKEQLYNFLEKCTLGCIETELVRESLASRIHIFVYQVLQQCHLSGEAAEKWNQKSQCYQIFAEVDSRVILERKAITLIEEFRQDVLHHLKQDEFVLVLRYLEAHKEGRISLVKLAEMSCMSTASFCKKFKERTGMTLIQYINHQKIEGVKQYLREGNASLGEIAEWTGFCNENYMVRVFKKNTGQTVKEFKNRNKSI